MKFQDDISNMNTYIHTYIHTYIRTYIRTSQNQYVPYFFKVGGIIIVPIDFKWEESKLTFYAPNFEKGRKHIGFGLSVCPSVQNILMLGF